MQIIIKSKKEDLIQHINKLEKNEEEEKIENIKKMYIESIRNLNSETKSDSKQFFILIKQNPDNNQNICFEQLNEKYFKIKECLVRCGNKTSNIKTLEEVKTILKKYFYLEN